LLDPEGLVGRHLNPKVHRLADLDEIRFLGLVGEPGMGKSTALEEEITTRREELERDGNAVAYLRLRECDSVAEVRLLFEKEEAISEWRAGSRSLRLFLDDVDEARLQVPAIAKALARELRNGPKERLWVRVACRIADWQQLPLSEEMAAHWGSKHSAAYQLCPLRRSDVEAAVAQDQRDPERFLDEITRRGAGPVAARPLTLLPLLAKYRRDEPLPKDPTQLFEAACLDLLRENSDFRQEIRKTGSLDMWERLDVAAAMSAAMLFTGRPLVWFRADRPEDESLLVPGDLARLEYDGKQTTREAVEEVLGTAFFSAASADRLSWAQWSYGEFLAACYVRERGVPLAQLHSLLTNGSDPEERIAPQLRQTAAWLATMLRDVFDYLLEREPEVLFENGFRSDDPTQRKNLVRALLNRLESGALLPGVFSSLERVETFDHPGLAEQLRPVVSDPGRPVSVRSVAIRIVQACKTQALQSDLADLALDQTEEHALRSDAARALVKVGDPGTRRRLLPLARGQAGTDPGQKLRGDALEALWPDLISLQEMVPLLTPPESEREFHAYHYFLRSGFAAATPPDRLVEVLQWLSGVAGAGRIPPHLEATADSVVWKALEYMELPGVLPLAARVAAARLRHGRPFSPPGGVFQGTETAIPDAERRHHFLRALAPAMQERRVDPVKLRLTRPPLITGGDLLWLLQALHEVQDTPLADFWVDMVGVVFKRDNPEMVEAIRGAAETQPMLESAYGFTWQPQAVQHSEAAGQDGSVPSAEGVTVLLDRCASENQEPWEALLERSVFDRHWAGSVGDELDLTRSADWEAADPEVRRRILRAAEDYIVRTDLPADRETSAGMVPHFARAGHVAFLLLHREASERLDLLPREVWERWVPALLASTLDSAGEGWQERVALSREAYRRAPAAWLANFERLLDGDSSRGGRQEALLHVSRCWDASRGPALLQIARKDSLAPRSLRALLALLLENHVGGAVEYAADLIRLPVSSPGPARAQAVAAAASLIQEGRGAGWDAWWTAVQADLSFGRSVMESAVDPSLPRSDIKGPILDRLGEDQIAELYAWLREQYPDEDDPDSERSHAVGIRERLGDWKASLLKQLASRGTWEAVDALRAIQDRLPGPGALRAVVEEAVATAREGTWEPAALDELRRLLDDPRNRRVRNADDLLQLLEDALGRLQRKLQVGLNEQGLRAVSELWNEITTKLFDELLVAAGLPPIRQGGIGEGTSDPAACRESEVGGTASEKAENRPRACFLPKDEDRLSDYVARFLEEDLQRYLVTIVRERQVNRGELTDIHITLQIPVPEGNPGSRVSVVVETKGCWHPALRTAMENQLVGKYLRDSPTKHGIYLVGWFVCEAWRLSGDRRFGTSPKYSLQQAQRLFQDQASGLSRERRVVRAFVLDASLREEETGPLSDANPKKGKSPKKTDGAASKPRRDSGTRVGRGKKASSSQDSLASSDLTG
jgi:hypothetical protein